MDEIQVKQDFKNNGVDDNPFDVLLDRSIELLRTFLFMCNRYKNVQLPECISLTDSHVDFYLNEIQKEFDKVKDLSLVSVEVCRNTSYPLTNGTLDEINRQLCDIRECIHTRWNKSVPCHSLEFDRIKLGEDSPEFKRLLELREICDEELEPDEINYLNSCIDVICKPNDCIKYWMTQESFNSKKAFIDKYNLNVNELEYMCSYLEKVKRGEA